MKSEVKAWNFRFSSSKPCTGVLIVQNRRSNRRLIMRENPGGGDRFSGGGGNPFRSHQTGPGGRCAGQASRPMRLRRSRCDRSCCSPAAWGISSISAPSTAMAAPNCSSRPADQRHPQEPGPAGPGQGPGHGSHLSQPGPDGQDAAELSGGHHLQPVAGASCSSSFAGRR